MKKLFYPESLMMSYGYDPHLSEGAIKTPLFTSSTFAFKTAEEGKSFFEVAYQKRPKNDHETLGLIYSRINNPNLEIVENRLCLWEDAEEAALFQSGMAAISTSLLEYLRPGDLLMYSLPLYGGSAHFIEHFLTSWGIEVMGIYPDETAQEIVDRKNAQFPDNPLKLLFIETPANPTNDLFDLSMCRNIADHFSSSDLSVKLIVDNTFLGPIFQKPLAHGADLVIYSATKYLGGHSDLIAGAVLGKKTELLRIKTLRTFLGNMASPFTAWLLQRSLETLQVRMIAQQSTAQYLAKKLRLRPDISNIRYLGHFDSREQATIWKKQCTGTGAILTIEIKGGEREAFSFLNALKIFKIAVSLGGTESLAQHPYSMTHAGMQNEDKQKYGITENMVRLSIGLENKKDLLWDIEQALDAINLPRASNYHHTLERFPSSMGGVKNN